MKKIILNILFVSAFSTSFSIVCMEQNQNGIDFTTHLPQDVTCLVIHNVLRPREREKSLKDLDSLWRVNKLLRNLINDKYTVKAIAPKLDLNSLGLIKELIRYNYLSKVESNQKYLDLTKYPDISETFKKYLKSSHEDEQFATSEFLQSHYPLRGAIQAKDFDYIHFLLKSGSELNPEIPDITPTLFFTMDYYSKDLPTAQKIISLLVQNGADINEKYEDSTLLHKGIQKGNISFVKLILKHKPDLSIECNGKTAYGLALEKNNPKIMDALVKAHSE